MLGILGGINLLKRTEHGKSVAADGGMLSKNALTQRCGISTSTHLAENFSGWSIFCQNRIPSLLPKYEMQLLDEGKRKSRGGCHLHSTPGSVYRAAFAGIHMATEREPPAHARKVD